MEILEEIEEALVMSSSNDDLITLYRDYKESEIYEEIKLFLNDLDPKWRKQKALGAWAPEFCLWIIRLHEYEFNERENGFSFKAWLVNVYEDIGEHYQETKIEYQSVRVSQLIINFEQEFDGRYSNQEFDKELFDKEYAEFVRTDGEKEYFLF